MTRTLLSVLVATLGALLAAPALAADQGVNVGDNFFAPAKVGVKPGESVTWTASGGNPHNVAFDDGKFANPSPPRSGPWTTRRSFPAEGAYRYFCEVHGGPGGQGMSGTVYVNAAANVPPLAIFTASPNPAQTGQKVSFNGSGSSDSDGTIARYEWDLDGDGSFETDTATTPTASRSYASPGTLAVKLRVRDSDGVTAEATRSVRIDAPPVSVIAPPLMAPSLGSNPLPPSFAASKKSITVSRSGRFSYSLRGEPGMSGEISLRSVAKVTVSARRHLNLGTKRFTVPGSGLVKVSWKLSGKNLRILKRSKRIKFRAKATLRNAAGVASSGATTLTLKKPTR